MSGVFDVFGSTKERLFMSGTPGHGGKKGCSGRKRIPGNEEKAWFEDQRAMLLPVAMRTLREKARSGSETAAKYIVDRFLGTPHQSIDHRVKAGVIVTPDEYELASRAVLEAQEQALLPQGVIVVDEVDE